MFGSYYLDKSYQIVLQNYQLIVVEKTFILMLKIAGAEAVKGRKLRNLIQDGRKDGSLGRDGDLNKAR